MCGILIVANILRIFFWITTGFANNLLLQSFFVLGIQVALLDLCIKLGYKKKDDVERQGFWRWNHLNQFCKDSHYLVIFMVVFALGVGLITALFLWL